MASTSTERPIQLAVLNEKRLRLHLVNDEKVTETDIVKIDDASLFQYSPNGDVLAVVREGNKIVMLDSATGKPLREIPCTKAAKGIKFSPLGTYLMVFENIRTAEADAGVKNLKLYNVKTGEGIGAFQKRIWHPNNWHKHMQFSQDEKLFCKWSKGLVEIWDFPTGEMTALDTTKASRRIVRAGIASFSISPSISPYHIATFIPVDAPTHALVSIYSAEDLKKPVLSKAVGRAEEVYWAWNSLGKSLVVQTIIAVDASHSRYMGQRDAWYLKVDTGLATRVDQSKQGGVHEVGWSPSGRVFIAIYGKMPSLATVYNQKCNRRVEFGDGHRNTIKWSPSGAAVLLGGFGSLKGQFEIWEPKVPKKFGAGSHNTANIVEWAPNSRYILTATTAVRMTEGFRYQVLRYGGSKLADVSCARLQQVAFRPAAPGAYESRPLSPRILERKFVVKKVGAYRPPGAKGAVSFAFRDKSASTGPKKYDNSTKKSQARGSRPKKPSAPKPKASKPKPKPKPSKPVDPTKRLRALRKKLRQIETLQERLDGGDTLNVAQREKIEALPAIQKEIGQMEKLLEAAP